ncbi:unnamed protein product [Cutaneotrichosporon oleaginosum]
MSDQSSLARAHPDHPTLSQLNTSPQSKSRSSSMSSVQAKSWPCQPRVSSAISRIAFCASHTPFVTWLSSISAVSSVSAHSPHSTSVGPAVMSTSLCFVRPRQFTVMIAPPQPMF